MNIQDWRQKCLNGLSRLRSKNMISHKTIQQLQQASNILSDSDMKTFFNYYGQNEPLLSIIKTNDGFEMTLAEFIDQHRPSNCFLRNDITIVQILNLRALEYFYLKLMRLFYQNKERLNSVFEFKMKPFTSNIAVSIKINSDILGRLIANIMTA